jgi:hypothetical protein
MMATFLGPSWGPDGEPVLVAALDGTKGRSRQRHLQRTLLVVDDYGNAVSYTRCCSECRNYAPLQFEFYATHRRGTLGMNARCNVCSIMANIAIRRADPDRARAAGRRRYRQRMDTDPVFREKVRKKSADDYRRRVETGDVEQMRALARAAARRHRERLKRDPDRLARARETARINSRLRRERVDGINVTELRVDAVPMPRDWFSIRLVLPGPPLAAAMRRYAEKHDVSMTSVCEHAGFPLRSYTRWDNGEGASVPAIDAALTEMDMCWFEVWTEESGAYELARAVFEADDLRRVA